MLTTAQASVQRYSIRDLLNYRALPWRASEEFWFLTDVPTAFEPFFVQPTYYCCGLLTEGKLDIDIDHECHCLTTQSLLVYRPGQRWKVRAVAEGTKGAFVLFTRKFLDYLNENIFSVRAHSFLSPGRPALLTLGPADSAHLQSLFSDIFALLRHLSPHDWEAIARTLTSALLYETDTLLKEYLGPLPAGLSETSRLFDAFSRLVKEEAAQHRNLSFYADALCISPGHLHAVVKKTVGQSPRVLLHQQVIQQAKYLLATTPDSMGDIAEHLHFSDTFAFSKFFKKHTGDAPSHYRRRAAAPADSDI
ncbi:MAG: helix-turn-helix domain-containing protein [Janthinobacterium lividum]